MDWSKINLSGLGEGFSGILGGLFGNSGQAFKDYQDELRKYYEQGQNYQTPYYQAGVGGISNFQDWLSKMKNPEEFINNLMGHYQESPYAHYLQKQAMRGAQNQGSGTGLTGSTPMAQFMQQNAKDISSGDMQNWLSRVLGVNTQYGQGQQNLMTTGQNAANALTNMTGDMGRSLAEAQFGRTLGRNQDRNDLWGGLFKTGLAVAPLFI